MTALAYNDDRNRLSGDRSLLKRMGHGISVYLANFAVAMAWSNGRRADPADLQLAGLSKEMEERMLASTQGHLGE